MHSIRVEKLLVSIVPVAVRCATEMESFPPCQRDVVEKDRLGMGIAKCIPRL